MVYRIRKQDLLHLTFRSLNSEKVSRMIPKMMFIPMVVMMMKKVT